VLNYKLPFNVPLQLFEIDACAATRNAIHSRGESGARLLEFLAIRQDIHPPRFLVKEDSVDQRFSGNVSQLHSFVDRERFRIAARWRAQSPHFLAYSFPKDWLTVYFNLHCNPLFA
jgi:hypothetical protein